MIISQFLSDTRAMQSLGIIYIFSLRVVAVIIMTLVVATSHRGIPLGNLGDVEIKNSLTLRGGN